MSEHSRRPISLVHHKVRGVPLYVIGLCGLCGVLVDLDHVIQGIWFQDAGTGRILHTPILIGACLAILYCCACITRLYFKLVLRRK